MRSDGCLDLSDLQPFLPDASEDPSFRDGHDAAPTWQNAANARNYALKLVRVEELSVDAVLEQVDQLCQEDYLARTLVDYASQRFCDAQVLLQFPLLSGFLEVLDVPLLGLVFETLLGLDHVEGLR